MDSESLLIQDGTCHHQDNWNRSDEISRISNNTINESVSSEEQPDVIKNGWTK